MPEEIYLFLCFTGGLLGEWGFLLGLCVRVCACVRVCVLIEGMAFQLPPPQSSEFTALVAEVLSPRICQAALYRRNGGFHCEMEWRALETEAVS